MIGKLTFALAVIGEVAAVQREPLLTWKAKAPKGHPVDYFVPNFGTDRDIAVTQQNLRDSERALNHKWNVVPKKLRPAPHPVDYFVPNFGLDHDVVTTQSHIRDSEHQYSNSNWKPEPFLNYNVQVEDSDSDDDDDE